MAIINACDLAFVRFRAPDLDQTRNFMLDFGLKEAGRTQTRLWMRGSGDAPFLHMTERGETGFAGFGIQAESIADLHRLAEAENVPVTALADPGGGSCVQLTDPDGFSVEVVADQNMADGRHGSGVQAWNNALERRRVNDLRRVNPGPSDVVRLGHLVLFTENIERSWDWYQERFGLLISDDVRDDADSRVALFTRCDRGASPVDHHSICLATNLEASAVFHHAAFEVRDLDNLIAGHEALRNRGHRHSQGIGRHILGSQVFDYWLDPWGNRMEHWTDGDLLTSEVPTNVADVPTMLGRQWSMSSTQNVAGR